MATLAERIALDLMTTGGINERVAHRLQLHTSDGKYLGGWSLHALTQRIEKHLRGEFDSISAGGMAADLGMLNEERPSDEADDHNNFGLM